MLHLHFYDFLCEHLGMQCQRGARELHRAFVSGQKGTTPVSPIVLVPNKQPHQLHQGLQLLQIFPTEGSRWRYVTTLQLCFFTGPSLNIWGIISPRFGIVVLAVDAQVLGTGRCHEQHEGNTGRKKQSAIEWLPKLKKSKITERYQ